DRVATTAAFERVAKDIVESLAGLRATTLARDVVVGPGESVNVEEVLEILTMELAMHSVDLARASGEVRQLWRDAIRGMAQALPQQLEEGAPPPAGLSFVLRSLLFDIPLAWRNGEWRREIGADPCYIEGAPDAVLLFALGREPFDESRLSASRADRARS